MKRPQWSRKGHQKYTYRNVDSIRGFVHAAGFAGLGDAYGF